VPGFPRSPCFARRFPSAPPAPHPGRWPPHIVNTPPVRPRFRPSFLVAPVVCAATCVTTTRPRWLGTVRFVATRFPPLPRGCTASALFPIVFYVLRGGFLVGAREPSVAPDAPAAWTRQCLPLQRVPLRDRTCLILESASLLRPISISGPDPSLITGGPHALAPVPAVGNGAALRAASVMFRPLPAQSLPESRGWWRETTDRPVTGPQVVAAERARTGRPPSHLVSVPQWRTLGGLDFSAGPPSCALLCWGGAVVCGSGVGFSACGRASAEVGLLTTRDVSLAHERCSPFVSVYCRRLRHRPRGAVSPEKREPSPTGGFNARASSPARPFIPGGGEIENPEKSVTLPPGRCAARRSPGPPSFLVLGVAEAYRPPRKDPAGLAPQ